ncbi:hypothetical protein [Arsenicicoccus sp. oral taxon 190]|uniref:hypothetical protein n=1 Tax=Arsenicicoccus sp. oral taxon 190 TaxID=1658671 RepID=UPI00067A3D05|nr:hypothetical protein [Arsenicicoccus sp. oral taxon 190]AKT51054.1 hypothetical protein ADJ73_06510 [Arsenicicoccus sp. oral taxon 190]
MRRTLVITTIAATALGLSACGGAPKDLSQDKAKSSMLEAGDLPDGGWQAGSVDETKPTKDDKSADQMLNNAKDVPAGCKEAMNSLASMSADSPSSYAKRSYTKGSGKDKTEVEVVVETLGKAKDVPPQLTKVAETCKTLKMGTGAATVDLKMSSPKLDTKDAKGLQMSAEAMGQKMAVSMAAANRGNNLVVVQTQGTDADKANKLVDTLLGKQAEKVEKAAG